MSYKFGNFFLSFLTAVIVATLIEKGAGCKQLWDNSCVDNGECCTQYCFKEPHWATGVCKPNDGGSATQHQSESSENHERVERATGIDYNLNEEGLKAHNYYRRKHGLNSLKFSKELAKYAQNWAQHLANKDGFYHSKGKYGENLYALRSTDRRRVASAWDACKDWYSEIKDYTFGARTGSSGTGHFTAMVWKTTRLVGMGRARSRSGRQIFVASYYPAGNVIGQYAKNVPNPVD